MQWNWIEFERWKNSHFSASNPASIGPKVNRKQLGRNLMKKMNSGSLLRLHRRWARRKMVSLDEARSIFGRTEDTHEGKEPFCIGPEASSEAEGENFSLGGLYEFFSNRFTLVVSQCRYVFHTVLISVMNCWHQFYILSMRTEEKGGLSRRWLYHESSEKVNPRESIVKYH